MSGPSAGGPPVAATGTIQPSPPDRSGEIVVLTHGFMANRWLLKPLARRLRQQGWSTSTWGYPSLRPSVLEHGRRFAERLSQLNASPAIRRIHVVAHSMGGIVTRAALREGTPSKLGRLVMLAPPNRGSFVATATAGLGSVFRPVAELTTHPQSLVNTLEEPLGIEVGVIAAELDQLISLESTRLTMPHAHTVIRCMHSSLLFRRDAALLTNRFLDHGSFLASDDVAQPQGE